MGEYSRVYHLHRLYCPKKDCKLNQYLGIGQKRNVEEVITEILADKKDEDI